MLQNKISFILLCNFTVHYEEIAFIEHVQLDFLTIVGLTQKYIEYNIKNNIKTNGCDVGVNIDFSTHLRFHL